MEIALIVKYNTTVGVATGGRGMRFKIQNSGGRRPEIEIFKDNFLNAYENC